MASYKYIWKKVLPRFCHQAQMVALLFSYLATSDFNSYILPVKFPYIEKFSLSFHILAFYTCIPYMPKMENY
ncbi:hypothetical protein XELAEV_18012572mg [Xenopus laevis]|uniref:Uncharacterized protein n=1 Tax=Xenopus laevis TaxID=8355 RepID=A0A974DMV9_XENLA|nr:hypothetical protein XELAEV_18012572mg [Xenopus laevis]